MTLDKSASIYYQQFVKPEAHGCYINSFRLLPHLPEGSTYVQGLARIMDLGIPLDYGWCVFPDGETIIDISWCDRDGEIRYYPVKSWTLSELITEVSTMKRPNLPLSMNDKISTAQDYLAFLQNIMSED